MAIRNFPYGRWIGLDTTNTADNMSDRYLVTLTNAHVDIRGQIVKGPGTSIIEAVPGGGEVISLQHHHHDDTVLYYRNGADIDALATGTDLTLAAAFTGSTARVDTVQFAGKQVVVSKGQTPVVYDPSTGFAQDAGIPSGGVVTTVLNRLVVADLPNETELQIGKLNTINDFVVPGSPTSVSPLTIDILNQLTGVDSIRGLGNFEGDKLAIFCQNETLVYAASEDRSNWTIVRDFRVPFGTIGRGSIQRVGNDIFFCSAHGLHSLRRSINGLTLETILFSRLVQDLYTDLRDAMPSEGEPTASWNPNLGLFTIYFPTTTSWVRMVFHYDPQSVRGGFQGWSYADNDGLSAASYFGGDFRTAGNGYIRNGGDPAAAVNMTVRTPTLYQGAPHKEKSYKRLYVRASGEAQFDVNAYDENGRLLQSTTHQPFPPTPWNTGIPTVAPERPVSIPFNHRAYGVSVEIVSTGEGELKILDMAIDVKV